MLKLIKYLKNSIIPVLFIVVLLFMQANADLSLPEYTSKIVNVGIQQSGIESPVPDVITENTYNKLLLLLNDEDSNKLKDSYNLINYNSLTEKVKKDYLKKYPIIKDENIYILDDNNLGSILSKPLIIIGSLESNSDQSKMIKSSIINNLPDTLKNQDNFKYIIANDKNAIFTILGMMNSTQRQLIASKIGDSMSTLPDSIINQGAIAVIKSEYQKIGINTDKLQTNYILKSGFIMLVIALLSMAIAILVGLLGAKISSTIAQRLRGQIFEKVMSFSNNEFKKYGAASLITRSTNDVEQVRNMTVMLLRIVIYAPILGIGGVFKILNTNTSMSWILALAVAVIFIVLITLFSFVIPKFKIIQKLIDKLNLVSREFLTGVSVIRAFNTQKHEEKKFDKANKDLTKTSLFVNRIMSSMFPLMNFIMNVVIIIIVWAGAHSINDGTMQIGDMMAFIQYTIQVIMAFLMISIASVMLPRASVSADRINEVLATDSTILDSKDPKKIIGQTSTIKFNDVSFRYPDADYDIISNINFEAKPGETTAFIGSTGSGKSTIVNLIPRFFDVSKGSITINDTDIRDASLHDLRNKIGFVPQKGILFSGTIATNIKYSNQDLSDEIMIKATNIAQASEFVENKEEKFDSAISQGGTNVSGGQKQRISIARAIAANPDIYIFDDSFSALDYKTDAKLRNDLNKITKDKTVLIVAQRINTIMHADQIIVLDNGKVVGKGTHKQLLKNCDVYKEIALSQLSEEELA